MKPLVHTFGFTFALVATGCVVGPKAGPESPLNDLSSEHYANGVATPIPVLIERRMVYTTIAGQALLQSTGFYEPQLTFVELVLYAGEVEMARARTDKHGSFKFSADLKDGPYRIAAADKRYSGEVGVLVTNYPINDVVLKVRALDDPAQQAAVSDSKR